MNQSVVGVNKNLSLINLHLITGRIGTPGNGPFSLTGQPNAMGGREVGGLANILPAHRDVTNATHRAEMEEFWNSPVKIADKPGLTATEMFQAMDDDKLKAIWIINTNPLVSMPDVNSVERALKKGRFVVVQDVSSRADTVAMADVVLPAAAWLEKEGTMTNAERRITYLPKILDAPGEALPDVEIIWRFAQKMGFEKEFNYQNFRRSIRRIRTDHDGYLHRHHRTEPRNSAETAECAVALHQSKSRYPRTYPPPVCRSEILHAQSTRPNPRRPRRQRLGTDRSGLPAGADHRPHPRPVAHHDQNRPRGQAESARAAAVSCKSIRRMPPERGIQQDQLVTVRSRRGEVRVKAQLSDDMRQGVCFLPMHWGKILNSTLGRANNLTNSLVDPRSKEPDFKFSAVRGGSVPKTRRENHRDWGWFGGAGFCQCPPRW